MKAELVLIPSPPVGHLRPMLEMAKLFVDRDDRLSITVLIIPSCFGGDHGGSSSSYITSVSHDDRLRYNVLPGDYHPEQTFLSYMESRKPHVRAAVTEIANPALPDSPRLAGFILDMFCMAMMDVADEFGVPVYTFSPMNAGFLGFMFHVQFLYDEKKYDVTELKDSETELEVPCLTRPFPAKCTPSGMLSKEWLPKIYLDPARKFRKSKGILVNTFAELEPYALKFLSGGDTPPVYPVGPVLDLKTDGRSEILRWLDEQPPRSVVFLCFGSLGGFSEEQAREIAVALERSGHRFLWALRRQPPDETMELPGAFTNLEEVLPEGFLDRTAEIGKVIGWAPQVAVLSNPAVGGFVSHCGWNSALESLWFGVPTATWPLYGEQQFNAFNMVEELGLAAEIRKDTRGDFLAGEKDMVTAAEIERGIRCLMEHDSKVRSRVKEMSEKIHVAAVDGGSSHAALVKFIQDVLENIP